MWRWLLVPSLSLACSSNTPAPSAPEPEAQQLSKAEQCLEAARAEREPRSDAPAKIELRHILVRHAELADPRGAIRSPEEACLRALEALQALEGGASWSSVSGEYNDAKDDSLGRVSMDELAPEFANAAFALERNQLSYVVETDRGFHIILRK